MNYRPFKKILLVLLIGLGGPLLAGVPAGAQVPGSSRSAKACAICHFRWIETFFIQGRGTELVEYQAEKVVATPDMCFSCHDGSIMDSRKRMVAGKGHKTGVAPPASMNIPELFPLDEQGRVDCATCHTAHGVPSEGDKNTTIFMRTSNRDSAMCRQCHPGRQGATDTGNHPMGTVKEPIPSTILAMSHGTPKRGSEMICETCHTAHGSMYDAYLIQNYRNSDLCLACHPEKSAVSGKGLRNPGHVVNVAPQTAVIPSFLMEKGARVGSKGEVICSTCHDVHGVEAVKNLLVTGHDARSSLCMTCHADKAVVSDSRHNLARTAAEVANLQGQTAAQAGGDYTTRMCMSCHGPEKFAARPRLAAPSHPVRVDPFRVNPADLPYQTASADPDTLSLPLYDLYGVRKARGEMTCTTCHDPHRRTPGTPSGTNDAPKNALLRQPAPELCRQCHKDKFRIAASKHNLLKTAPESVNSLDETPEQAGLCGNCHLTHGGLETFLWSRPLAETAAAEPPAPCLSCHREGGLAASRTLGPNDHPVHVKARLSSSISNMPLFDADGRLSEEGKIACYTCHDPHRWDPERPVSEDEAFSREGDSATSFLRLQAAPSAALCNSRPGPRNTRVITCPSNSR